MRRISVLTDIHDRYGQPFEGFRDVDLEEDREYVSQFRGFRRGVSNDSVLLGHDVASLDSWIPTFRDIVASSSSTVKSPLQFLLRHIQLWRGRYVVSKRRDPTTQRTPSHSRRTGTSTLLSNYTTDWKGYAMAQLVEVGDRWGSTGIFLWLNPPYRTMALESTQPLTEMITRISWRVKAAGP